MNVLVMIHAFPLGRRMWEDLDLPQGWRLVAPALPGFDGAPLPPADSTSIDDYARAALATLDESGVDRFVLGGVSMGGYVAFALWRLAPARCRALVLSDTRAGADTEQGSANRATMLHLVRREGPSAVATDMLPKLLGPTTRRDRPEVAGRVRQMIEAQSTEAIAAAIVRLRDRPASTSTLSTIDVPTLIIVGDEDEITPPVESAAMHRAIAGSTLVRIASAGHLPNLETPGEFNAALRVFLAGLG